MKSLIACATGFSSEPARRCQLAKFCSLRSTPRFLNRFDILVTDSPFCVIQ
jgi:hypothetical protein